MSQLDQWRSEAQAIIKEMTPLKAQLHELQRRHAQLAWDIEQESRRQCAVKHIARGVSGRKPRKINTDIVLKQFAMLPASVQAKLVAEFQAAQ
jgi:hypothetical protein